MRWFANGLVTLLAGLSALLLLVLAALWGRSYVALDHVERNAVVLRDSQLVESVYTVQSGRGVVLVGTLFTRAPYRPDAIGRHAQIPLGTQYTWEHRSSDEMDLLMNWNRNPWRRLGFAFDHHASDAGEVFRRYEVAVPHWFLLLLLTPLPALSFRRYWIVRRRARQGRCIACGYDLRSSPERCPECGFTPAPAKVSSVAPQPQSR